MKKLIKTTILTLLLLTLSISTALLSYLHFFASKDIDLSGQWTAELDMTGEAAATAYAWLQDIEGVSISLEEMESYMNELTIQVDINFEQAGASDGTFVCNVSQESYESCKQAAYEALTTAFRDLLAQRLHMAGYEGGTDEESIDALVAETFGMSTEEYLMSCGPELVISLEELQAQYDGSGTYEMTEDILTRRFDDGGAVVTRTERYICQDAELILLEETGADSSDSVSTGYPMIYTLQQIEEGRADL